MFSVELKINGQLISHLYGHNVTTDHGKPIADPTHFYEWEYYEVNKGTEALKSGSVSHRREAGLTALVQKILKKVCK